MITQPELRQRGLALFNELYGNGAGEALRQDMADICPDFTDISIEWAMGGIMSRAGLDPITRELVVIASCVTLGHTVPQLKAHTQAALNAGASREQIIETILQLLFYAGGAAVRNALVHVREILNSPQDK
ncbi:carboxymuconolactone decarboxylase family protein [Pantoea cypripedii]|uniref:Carboxymuconolactone decarboxylase n=1 Tax=Pantoea cypripedii TaxID=55209 RepID=A0A1X1EFW6_PANCY|nr:carboxymuconolactone decarboxylase family protein [Pantoea cypripedii]MBP2199889.1 4-carboxymuconolactone decarboxylase [Pantoea cypripedii]ORM87848.1 carboxymuconolactone decarboxylase [Pantoea cypripedii]QGY31621.1 carboxymuconolactone decarboxylase family protein [Pantoea cypripedii]